MSKKSDRRRTL